VSRSRRKPIIQDRPRNSKKSASYWRPVRRVMNQTVRGLNEESEDEIIPNPQEIVNDYDYSDYKFDMRWDDDETVKKISRK
jgi:hypothetical protein